MNKDILGILTIFNLPKVGKAKLNKLINSNFDFSKQENLFERVNQINIIKDFNKKMFNEAFQRANEEINYLNYKNIMVISQNDKEYPKLLLKIKNPPPLIYAKGNIDLLNSKTFAVVGTRNPTENSKKITKNIVETLIKENYTIVSGLAMGVDTIAHKTTLDNNGKTIAVLANGLETIYPDENKELANNIIQNNGLLISEFSKSDEISRWAFVARDEIQSGICKAIIVIQADLDSGTMHTARFAKEQNRKIFVYENSCESNLKFLGNEKLLLEGSIPIKEARELEDILISQI